MSEKIDLEAIKELVTYAQGQALDRLPSDGPPVDTDALLIRDLSAHCEALIREVARLQIGCCDVCWTQSFEPSPIEEGCIKVHPHEGDHVICVMCEMVKTAIADKAELKAARENNDNRVREIDSLRNCLTNWQREADTLRRVGEEMANAIARFTNGMQRATRPQRTSKGLARAKGNVLAE